MSKPPESFEIFIMANYPLLGDFAIAMMKHCWEVSRKTALNELLARSSNANKHRESIDDKFNDLPEIA